MQKSAFIFDFDGTLVDTAIELVATLNRLLLKHGRPALPFEAIRRDAGRGSEIMIPRAFGITQNDPWYPELRKGFFEDYTLHCADDPRFFPGIEQALLLLNKKKIPWGIVTNKPVFFVTRIIEKLPVLSSAAAVFTPETLVRTKPDPEGINRILSMTGAQAQFSFYAGDDERDARAARAAGVAFIACGYGYLGKNPDISSWKPDISVMQSEEILTLVEKL